MSFDRTKPTNTSKIRNLGSEIRANFEAIEDAEDSFKPQAINYADRDELGLVSDPTPIDDTIIAYCKQNADGDPKLFSIDPDSNIFQLLGGNLTDHESSNYTLELGLGLTLKFGKSTASGGGILTTFAEAFPTSAIGIVISPSLIGPASTATSGLSVSGFTGYLQAEAGTQTIYYIAWGN